MLGGVAWTSGATCGFAGAGKEPVEKQEGGHMVGVHPAGPGELKDESAPTWSVSELRPRAGRQRPACGCGPPRAGYRSCSLPPSSHWGCFGEDPGNLGLRPLNAEAQHSLLPRAKCSQGSRRPQRVLSSGLGARVKLLRRVWVREKGLSCPTSPKGSRTAF